MCWLVATIATGTTLLSAGFISFGHAACLLNVVLHQDVAIDVIRHVATLVPAVLMSMGAKQRESLVKAVLVKVFDEEGSALGRGPEKDVRFRAFLPNALDVVTPIASKSFCALWAQVTTCTVVACGM
jgi:hypothetical protein